MVKSFWCRLGIHNWTVTHTERNTRRLFKKLAKENGWGSTYKVTYFKCKRCGELSQEFED